MTLVFGIKNCDTVKKAKAWLDNKQIEYTFQDVRERPLTKAQVENWLEKLGAESLINKRGTTWKRMTPAEQERTMKGQAASQILANPTLFKRPVLEHDDQLYTGFSPEQYADIFK